MFERTIAALGDLTVQLFGVVLARPADDDAIERGECLTIIRHGDVACRSVLRIRAGNCLKCERCVIDSGAENADLIERRRKRHETVSTHASICRLHADDAAECRRLPNRPARFGSKADWRDARRHGRRRSA